MKKDERKENANWTRESRRIKDASLGIDQIDSLLRNAAQWRNFILSKRQSSILIREGERSGTQKENTFRTNKRQKEGEKEVMRFIYMDMYGKKIRSDSLQLSLNEFWKQRRRRRRKNYTHIKRRNMYSVQR